MGKKWSISEINSGDMMFWKPQYKWQLVEWLKQRYPDMKWERFSKKRLYKIYFSIREKSGK